MIISENTHLKQLTINEVEKSLLPFTCVCDRIPFEDKPFLRGSRTLKVDFLKEVEQAKLAVR